MKPEEAIMFNGRDWQLLKAFLLAQRDSKLSMLVGATDHDTSNKLRGALGMIQTLLHLETAAEQGR